ncbi:MAG: septum formation initiator family protein [Bdellovibrionota bacterium]|nr:septum formation initiator family protein [Deltaproteobacteria bacterium]
MYLINDKKDYFFIISWTYLVGLMVFSIIGDRGLLTSLSLWAEQQQLHKDIGLLENQVKNLQQDVFAFHHQDRRIYEYARETFNMQQDNEIQYIFGKRP